MIERGEIEAALAEALNLIQDEDLRKKTVDCWMLGIAEGGWQSLGELTEMPFTLLTPTRGVNFLEHTLAVTFSAIGLAEAQRKHYASMPYEINMDWLVAGGLVHDIGKLLEFERTPEGKYVKSHHGRCTRHPISGTVLAATAALPVEVQNIVACHAKEGDGRPKRIETVLVHQADFATFDPLVMKEAGTLIE